MVRSFPPLLAGLGAIPRLQHLVDKCTETPAALPGSLSKRLAEFAGEPYRSWRVGHDLAGVKLNAVRTDVQSRSAVSQA